MLAVCIVCMFGTSLDVRCFLPPMQSGTSNGECSAATMRVNATHVVAAKLLSCRSESQHSGAGAEPLCLVTRIGFTSALDGLQIMAVQAQLPFEVGTNQELAAVGVGNLAAGAPACRRGGKRRHCAVVDACQACEPPEAPDCDGEGDKVGNALAGCWRQLAAGWFGWLHLYAGATKQRRRGSDGLPLALERGLGRQVRRNFCVQASLRAAARAL